MKSDDLIIIILLVLVFFIPIRPNLKGAAVDMNVSEGMVAVASANMEFIEVKTPDKVECTCKGTKKVRSPDNLTDIDCPCGKDCACQKADDGVKPTDKCPCGCAIPNCKCGMPSRGIGSNESKTCFHIMNRQILYFSAKWCLPCKQFNKVAKAELKKHGWGVDEAKLSYIKEIDADKYPELVEKYKVEELPTFIILENGVEIDRLVGWSNSNIAKDITDFWGKNFK